MKALVLKDFGDMELLEIEEPHPIKDQIKIKICYAGICGTDLHAFSGHYSKTKLPVVLGHELAGIVTATGEMVKNIKTGDRVTTETAFATCGHCIYCATKDYNLCSSRIGLGTNQNGAFAQYTLTREESVHILPERIDFLSGALTEPVACAVHACMEKACIKAGQTVCVFGVGAIGMLVSQIAKALGARVILAGLAADKDRLALSKTWGVDKTVEQTNENLEEIIKDMTDGYGVDVAIECAGAIAALNKALEIVRKKGKVIQMGVYSKPSNEIETDLILHKEIEYIGSRSQKPSSWHTALHFMDSGLIYPKKVIGGIFPLENWREAFEHNLKNPGQKNILKCNEL